MAAMGTQPERTRIQKRRSDRLSIRIPVSIIGTDPNGHDFMDRAVTQMVSRFGASIVTKLALTPEQQLTLLRTDGKRIPARVIGQTSIAPDGHIYGVAFLNTTVNFWGIHFPPLNEPSIATAQLECCGCHARESVSLNELELEVFRANDRLRRVCAQCNGLTTWRLAEHAIARKPPQPTPELRSEEQSPEQPGRAHGATPAALRNVQSPQAERRMHPRIRVNLRACIAQHGAEDDVVAVVNMSRGGILVSSARVYRTECWIQLAVPYTPAAANIFVPARIVRHAEREGLHHYGIKYVRR